MGSAWFTPMWAADDASSRCFFLHTYLMFFFFFLMRLAFLGSFCCHAGKTCKNAVEMHQRRNHCVFKAFLMCFCCVYIEIYDPFQKNALVESAQM